MLDTKQVDYEFLRFLIKKLENSRIELTQTVLFKRILEVMCKQTKI